MIQMLWPLAVVVALVATAALVVLRGSRCRTAMHPARSPLSYEEERENKNIAYAKRQYVDGAITLEEFEAALPGILETAPAQGAGRPAVLSSPRPIKPADPTYLCGSTGEDLGRPGCTTAPETYFQEFGPWEPAAPVELVDGLGRVIARYPRTPALPPPRDPGKPSR